MQRKQQPKQQPWSLEDRQRFADGDVLRSRRVGGRRRPPPSLADWYDDDDDEGGAYYITHTQL